MFKLENSVFFISLLTTDIRYIHNCTYETIHLYTVIRNSELNTHYANTPIQYTAIFHGCKNGNFQMKNYKIFLIFAQNIDCGSS